MNRKLPQTLSYIISIIVYNWIFFTKDTFKYKKTLHFRLIAPFHQKLFLQLVKSQIWKLCEQT